MDARYITNEVITVYAEHLFEQEKSKSTIVKYIPTVTVLALFLAGKELT